MFVITMTFAPSAAASDARSKAAGDAVPSLRPSGNASEAAPPVPEGIEGLKVLVKPRLKTQRKPSLICYCMSPRAGIIVIANTSTKY
jgi:hypothetical protein